MRGLRPGLWGDKRRTAYIAGMALSISSFLLIWWLQHQDPFIRYFYPLGMLICAIWAWRLWHQARIERIEQEVILAMSLFFGAKFADSLFLVSDLKAHWNEVESSYWAMAYLMVLVYIAFNPRRGLLLGLTIVGVTLALGLLRLGGEVARGQYQTEFLALMRSEVRLLAMAGLLYILAAVKDRLVQMNLQVQEMHSLARTDPLTGLPNRLALSEHLEAQAHQIQGLYGVLLDLDHFKQINDRYGHAMGDEVLQEVGRRLRASLRKSDVLGRWGGEEFLIVMRGESQQDVLQALERLREDIAFWPFETVGAVSASFGVAEGHVGDSVNSLLERADRALYQAKRLGRNRVEIG